SAASNASQPTPLTLYFTAEQLAKFPGQSIDTVPKEGMTIEAMTKPEEIFKQNLMVEQIVRPRELTTLSAQEGFVIYFKVSLVAGLVIASPWVFWQIWSFIAAGLYPHEKRYVHNYLPISVGLFVVGV